MKIRILLYCKEREEEEKTVNVTNACASTLAEIHNDMGEKSF